MLLGLGGGLLPQVATAQPATSAALVSSAAAVGGHTATAGPEPGVSINKQQEQADTERSANKLILGVVVVLLLVIVYFGRRKRGRYRRKLKNLQNAKA